MGFEKLWEGKFKTCRSISNNKSHKNIFFELVKGFNIKIWRLYSLTNHAWRAWTFEQGNAGGRKTLKCCILNVAFGILHTDHRTMMTLLLNIKNTYKVFRVCNDGKIGALTERDIMWLWSGKNGLIIKGWLPEKNMAKDSAIIENWFCHGNVK